MQLFMSIMISFIAVGTSFIGIVVWFNKKMERIAKLERAVFDPEGKERYVTEHHCNAQHMELMKTVCAIRGAVILMNKAQMRYIHAVIDLLPEGDAKRRLAEVRDELSDERSIL
jgi:hypothetical protein